jgi:hypothetical protein
MHFGEKAWLTLFLEVLNSDALVPQALWLVVPRSETCDVLFKLFGK